MHALVVTNIAIENGHLYWIFQAKVVIFDRYVKLTEGKSHQIPLNHHFPMVFQRLHGNSMVIQWFTSCSDVTGIMRIG